METRVHNRALAGGRERVTMAFAKLLAGVLYLEVRKRVKSSLRNRTSEFTTSHVHVCMSHYAMLFALTRLMHDRKPRLFLVHPKDFACTMDHTESYMLFSPRPVMCS